jgi:hypothetical protein
MWCALLAVQRIMGIILLDIIDASSFTVIGTEPWFRLISFGFRLI